MNKTLLGAPLKRKGRGALTNPEGRFESRSSHLEDDGWDSLQEIPAKIETTLQADAARSVISRNDSPDLAFELSINPYRGCEHGCVYCFARPSHSYLGLSAGLDFETRLFYKADAADRLRAELSRPAYQPKTIALGINTDAYQPVERKQRITRSILEVLNETNHPVRIVTKSSLVLRDIDLLASMAERNLAKVYISITTFDSDLARTLEPRAVAPETRLKALASLSEAGIPTGVLVAPVIPVLTDAELETILARARAAGAHSAGYVMLRLPHEVKTLFMEWLAAHAPDRAEHVMSLIKQMHGGKAYDSTFGHRMRGSGPYADLIAQRYALACKRLRFSKDQHELDCTQFQPPRKKSQQMSLF